MLNGQRKEIPAGTTLAALVRSLGFQAHTVVADVSGAVVPASDFEMTILRENEIVELVRFVGGG
jgi:sulfur carrier protein